MTQFFMTQNAFFCWGAMETEGLQGVKLPFQNDLGRMPLFYIFPFIFIFVISVIPLLRLLGQLSTWLNGFFFTLQFEKGITP